MSRPTSIDSTEALSDGSVKAPTDLKGATRKFFDQLLLPPSARLEAMEDINDAIAAFTGESLT